MHLDLTKISSLLTFNGNDPLLFNSGLFLFLFFFLLLLNRILRYSHKGRTLLLTFFSLYFYYKASGAYVLLLIFNAIINFYFGNWIYNSTEQKRKKHILIFSILVNIGILSYFKYINFFIEVINNISDGSFDVLDVILPIGISYYTFKSLSYIIDIFLESIEPTKEFKYFALYVFFFPNILAGPIDRASKFLPQLQNKTILINKDIAFGLFLIMMGLIKKIVIADYISLNFIDRVFEAPLRFTGVENLLSVYGYTLQLYCDFSGYSDIAIGIALLLGYKLMENFNYPFKAKSITDFWKRWHISLSSWLLDYVFRPLQIRFRYQGILGNIFALLITFVLIGLWHGASWTFIVWGLFHGIFMSVGLLTRKHKTLVYNKLRLSNLKILRIGQIFITFNLVAFSFIFFRTENFQTVANIIGQIFFFFKPEVFIQFAVAYAPTFWLIVIGLILSFSPKYLMEKSIDILDKLPTAVQALLFTSVIWIVIQVQYSDIQPFIYFKF